MKSMVTGRVARMTLGLALALAASIARADAPKTVSVLQLSPDNAQVVLALPPADATVNTIATAAKKFVDPAEVDGFVKHIISEAADNTEAWGAQNFKEIAAKRGINGDAPLGVFVDFSKTVKKAAEQYAKDKAAAEAQAAEADKKAAEAAAKEGKPAPEKSKIHVRKPELTIPEIAGVLTISDQALAQRGLDQLINSIDELASNTPKDEKVGSVTIKEYGDYGYFFTGDKAVLGSLSLVKGIAAKVDAPGKVAYGSKECPASSDTEAVALIYGKRFFPLLAQALPTIKMDEKLRPTAEGAVQGISEGFESDEPIVLSLGVTPKGAILQSRLDAGRNKAIADAVGEAKPLRLAQWLPENTLAMISLRFNEQWKAGLMNEVLPAVASARGGEGAQQLVMAKQVIEQLGDEITIGIAAADQDFPSLFAMVSLAKPDETKGLLQMLVPAMPGEKHGDVDIQQLAVPIPVQFSISYPGDMILLSNNVDGMKKIIDLQKSKGATKFLASQNPPLDPATPRYLAALVNSKLLTDVLLPLSTLGVKLPGEAQDIATKVAPALHDVRIVNEVEGTWHVTAISVNLEESVKKADNR